MTNAYDVETIFTHADGHESYKPLMLDVCEWEQLAKEGVTQTLRYGFTLEEANIAAVKSFSLLESAFAAFIAAGGSIRNEVHTFFG